MNQALTQTSEPCKPILSPFRVRKGLTPLSLGLDATEREAQRASARMLTTLRRRSGLSLGRMASSTSSHSRSSGSVGSNRFGPIVPGRPHFGGFVKPPPLTWDDDPKPHPGYRPRYCRRHDVVGTREAPGLQAHDALPERGQPHRGEADGRGTVVGLCTPASRGMGIHRWTGEPPRSR